MLDGGQGGVSVSKFSGLLLVVVEKPKIDCGDGEKDEEGFCN